MKNQDRQALLRQLQLVEKEMLLDVIAICNKYNITYFLSSGTLLGAVRHKGFIPWDDDVDVEMPIKDYQKFLSIAQESLGKSYFVQNFMTDPNYHFAYTRIRKNNTACLRPYNRNDNVHQGVWIDIFPVVSFNTGISLFLKRKWIAISNFVQIKDSIDNHPEEFQKLLGPVGMFIMNLFSRIPMKKRQKLHNAMLNVIFNADSNKCSHMANLWGNITTIYPKEVYLGDPQLVEFEEETLNAPHDYIRYLEIKYGDYMKLPPEEERNGHGKDIIIDLENSFENYRE